MNGAGNDFIVVDNRFYHFTDEELGDLARHVCPRRRGIGADGILAFAPPESAGSHFRMRYVNADGSVGTMCANGARCLARYARRAGFTAEPLRMDTDSGPCDVSVPVDAEAPVRLFAGPPYDWRPDVRLEWERPAEISSVHYLCTGTEHVVCFVSDVSSVPVVQWGRLIRLDGTLAPAGANVNFVEVLSAAELRVRTFEKGVEAETLACGTGALASALAARFLRVIHDDFAMVHMPGGTLKVGITREGGSIRRLWLDGPATIVCRGTFEW